MTHEAARGMIHRITHGMSHDNPGNVVRACRGRGVSSKPSNPKMGTKRKKHFSSSKSFRDHNVTTLGFVFRSDLVK